MTPAALADLVRSVAHDVLTSHGLDPGALPPTVTLQRPRHPGHGDYATTVALQAAKQVGVAPRELAGWLAQELAQRDEVHSVEVAGPGFLNLRLGTEAQGEIVAQVLAAGTRSGTCQDLAGQRQQIKAPQIKAPQIKAPQIKAPQIKAPQIKAPQIKATVELRIGQPDNRTRMADLVAAVGVDAARYALIRCSGGSTVAPSDIDPDLWSKRTDDNPVFHVQYAHARLASLARNAADLGISFENAQLSLLDHEGEGALIRTLGEFPQVVASAAELREPHRVTRYLEELASAYHRFSGTCRVLPMGEEQPGPRHAARLALCEATRQVLAEGLDLLDISAPERM